MFKGSFSNSEAHGPILLSSQMLTVVACITLHHLIRQEARKDWLFEQYGNEDPVIIDSDDDNDEDVQMGDLMSSYLTIKMNQFRDDLVNILYVN